MGILRDAPAAARAGAANASRAEWMLRRLAAAGLRATGPRSVVVHAIAEQPGAFTAESLVDALRPRGIGRATVYRAIDVLERLGILTRMHLGGCHGYTVCDEGHHHHLVCRACQAVVPVDATGVEGEIRRLADRLKFRVDTHTLEFAGLCEGCQARLSGGKPPREGDSP